MIIAAVTVIIIIIFIIIFLQIITISLSHSRAVTQEDKEHQEEAGKQHAIVWLI